MTDQEWTTISLVLEHGWPGEFDDAARAAYRVILDPYTGATLLAAVRSLAGRGGRFRPSVGEIAAQVLEDPGRPTWSEARRLLFGARGLLTIRPEQACLARAEAQHPALAAFIRAEGYDRLRSLPVHDPDYGELEMRRLGDAWNRLEDRHQARVAAGLPAETVAPARRIGPARPDYLRAIGPAQEAA
jgi:hypothetical protein